MRGSATEAKMTSGDYDLVVAGWGPDYADPLTFGDLFGSWNQKGEGERRSRSGGDGRDPRA